MAKVIGTDLSAIQPTWYIPPIKAWEMYSNVQCEGFLRTADLRSTMLKMNGPIRIIALIISTIATSYALYGTGLS